TCPMLISCPHCKLVVRIDELVEHRLNQCSKKALFTKCDKCGDAVLWTELNQHHKQKYCRPNKTQLLEDDYENDVGLNTWPMNLVVQTMNAQLEHG
ncbi:MAG: hypothetical protein EZS28_050421, partial [Streblomastix strix]